MAQEAYTQEEIQAALQDLQGAAVECGPLNEFTATLKSTFAVAHLVKKMNERRAQVEKDYVQVRFTRGGQAYVYHCPGAKVHDWVVVPPNSVTNYPQCLQVDGIGKHGYQNRTIREAHLIPTDIAEGRDWGAGAR